MSVNFSDLMPNEQFEIRCSVVLMVSGIAVFGTLGNGVTIFIFSRLENRSKFLFLINLAIAELPCPLAVYWMVIASSVKGTWLFGTAGCSSYAFLNFFFGMASIGFLTVIAVERHIFICRSVSVKSSFTQQRGTCLTLVWLYALIMSFPPTIGWGAYAQDIYSSACSFDFHSSNLNSKSFMIYMLLLGYIVPSGVMLYCYTTVYRKIKSSRKGIEWILMRPLASKDNSLVLSRTFCSTCELNKPQRDDNIQQHSNTLETTTDSSILVNRLAKEEVKFAKLSLAVMLGFLICWTPYALLTVAYQFDLNKFKSPVAFAVTLVLAKSSVAVNPVIYAFGEKRFRQELIQLLLRRSPIQT